MTFVFSTRAQAIMLRGGEMRSGEMRPGSEGSGEVSGEVSGKVSGEVSSGTGEILREMSEIQAGSLLTTYYLPRL